LIPGENFSQRMNFSKKWAENRDQKDYPPSRNRQIRKRRSYCSAGESTMPVRSKQFHDGSQVFASITHIIMQLEILGEQSDS
jgi:hypothetical protein